MTAISASELESLIGRGVVKILPRPKKHNGGRKRQLTDSERHEHKLKSHRQYLERKRLGRKPRIRRQLNGLSYDHTAYMRNWRAWRKNKGIDSNRR